MACLMAIAAAAMLWGAQAAAADLLAWESPAASSLLVAGESAVAVQWSVWCPLALSCFPSGACVAFAVRILSSTGDILATPYDDDNFCPSRGTVQGPSAYMLPATVTYAGAATVQAFADGAAFGPALSISVQQIPAGSDTFTINRFLDSSGGCVGVASTSTQATTCSLTPSGTYVMATCHSGSGGLVQYSYDRQDSTCSGRPTSQVVLDVDMCSLNAYQEYYSASCSNPDTAPTPDSFTITSYASDDCTGAITQVSSLPIGCERLPGGGLWAYSTCAAGEGGLVVTTMPDATCGSYIGWTWSTWNVVDSCTPDAPRSSGSYIAKCNYVTPSSTAVAASSTGVDSSSSSSSGGTAAMSQARIVTFSMSADISMFDAAWQLRFRNLTATLLRIPMSRLQVSLSAGSTVVALAIAPDAENGNEPSASDSAQLFVQLYNHPSSALRTAPEMATASDNAITITAAQQCTDGLLRADCIGTPQPTTDNPGKRSSSTVAVAVGVAVGGLAVAVIAAAAILHWRRLRVGKVVVKQVPNPQVARENSGNSDCADYVAPQPTWPASLSADLQPDDVVPTMTQV